MLNPSVPWSDYVIGDSPTINWPHTQLIAISGTISFITAVLHSQSSTNNSVTKILVSLNLHNSPTTDLLQPPWVWFTLTHSSCGGVTTGKYWCGANFIPHAPETTQSLHNRRLRHILCPMVSGRPHLPPSDPDAMLGLRLTPARGHGVVIVTPTL
jgi:hypothetical protein